MFVLANQNTVEIEDKKKPVLIAEKLAHFVAKE
jgi:hypothetical protein